jgi:hypothetical protein
MATVTPGKIFTANEIVTPTNLNELGVPTISNIGTADIADGAVTQSKLNSSVTLVPTGAVMPFAMNSAPSGWLAANGAAISRTAYAGLFTAIGTIYGGGDGSTTFNLPDLRGYFVRGSGTNADGTVSGTFGAKQAEGFKSHTHTGTADSAGAHSHSLPTGGYSQYNETGGGGAVGSLFNGATNSGSAGVHTHTLTINLTGTTETRPANIALLYCIKA